MSFESTLVYIILCALPMAAFLTSVVRRRASAWRLLDVPNARSSHVTPTPRGGGLAVVVVFCLGLLVLGFLGRVDKTWVIALLPACAAVALVGFVDDRRGLPSSLRFAVHLGAAAYFLVMSRGPPQLGIGWMDASAALAFLVVLLGMVWLVNLFNFMDGIDGIAATEAVWVSLGLGLAGWLSGHGEETATCATLLGAASAGFLCWNWPPARIFMGDVGSGFLGLALGMLAILAVHESGIPVWVPVILLGAFVTDASLTLVRRILRGEKWYQSHRSHAYQWLSRRWRGHRPVVVAILLIDLLWLLPLALLAQKVPGMAGVFTLIAYLPLTGAAFWAGSGRPETPFGFKR